MPTMWPWSFRRGTGDYRRDSLNWMHWPTRGVETVAGNGRPGPRHGIDARPTELAVNHSLAARSAIRDRARRGRPEASPLAMMETLQ